MSKNFSPELGLTQEELLERLLSQGLARKVKKRIGGRIYEVLAIDAKVYGGAQEMTYLNPLGYQGDLLLSLSHSIPSSNQKRDHLRLRLSQAHEALYK